jgi:hypothetical protein
MDATLPAGPVAARILAGHRTGVTRECLPADGQSRCASRNQPRL